MASAGIQKIYRALVVDGDEDCRQTVMLALMSTGLEVDDAANGFEAVGRCYFCDYDLILTEIDLSEMDGCDLTTHLRGMDNGNKQAYVMALSERVNDTEEVLRCCQSGMDNVMVKPFSLDLLREKLIDWVRKREGNSRIKRSG